MKSYAEKVREARERAGMSQAQLAQRISLSVRSVTAYETGAARPRGTTAHRLAEVLAVSVEYLLNDAVQDPTYGLEREAYLRQMRREAAANRLERANALLNANRALFASDELTQSEKDAFFQAVMTAYVTAKERQARLDALEELF